MLIFLKLGGSLITDKHTPRTVRPETLARLMAEIAAARAAQPALQLVLGHGSGSFGHVEAKHYGTRQGVQTPAQWQGFAAVQHAAGLLNRAVVDAAQAAGLSVFNCPPSASVECRAGAIQAMALGPLQTALTHNLIPLVFGDVAMDAAWGGTIVSTEDVFGYLAGVLRPQRILLAGRDLGVLTQWPDGVLIETLTPDLTAAIQGAAAADVTGGMASKVQEARRMTQVSGADETLIFSGEVGGRVQMALLGERVPGTRIKA